MRRGLFHRARRWFQNTIFCLSSMANSTVVTQAQLAITYLLKPPPLKPPPAQVPRLGGYARTLTSTYHTRGSLMSELVPGKGQMGSALMGSMHISCFLTGGPLGTPGNLLLSPQKCQGVHFSLICRNSLLLQRSHWCRSQFVRDRGAHGRGAGQSRGGQVKQHTTITNTSTI